jgi:pseudouridine-5'-phosphate glycosidase
VPRRLDSAVEVAAAVSAARTLGHTAGFLVAVPCPEAEALPWELVAPAIEAALAEADRGGIAGRAVTPFVLERLADATDGRTLPANLALAEENARVAAEIAGELAQR